MSLARHLRVVTMSAILVLASFGLTAGTVFAYGHADQPLAQLEISGNCNNPDFAFCSDVVGLGGIWLWIEIDAGGTADVAGAVCGHSRGGPRGGASAIRGEFDWSTVVIPPSHGGDIAAYLASLERVIELAPAVMLPAHGDVIDKPIDLLREYIEHRRLRERQVIAALRAGIADPTEMVARIYPTLGAPLVPVARESVLAHLIKLEREGKARRDADNWSLVER